MEAYCLGRFGEIRERDGNIGLRSRRFRSEGSEKAQSRYHQFHHQLRPLFWKDAAHVQNCADYPHTKDGR